MKAAFERWWASRRTLNELKAISENAFAAGWAAAIERETTK